MSDKVSDRDIVPRVRYDQGMDIYVKVSFQKGFFLPSACAASDTGSTYISVKIQTKYQGV